MLFTNDIHVYFSVNVLVCVLYTYIILYTYCRHIHDVCIDVYIILFNMYITALGCFNGYARAMTLITYRLQTAL